MDEYESKLIETEMRRPRRAGYTTEICRAAKELDGIVVCANREHARLVASTFGVKTVNVKGGGWSGTKGPYLWDSYAFTSVASHISKINSDLINARVENQSLERLSVRSSQLTLDTMSLLKKLIDNDKLTVGGMKDIEEHKIYGELQSYIKHNESTKG